MTRRRWIADRTESNRAWLSGDNAAHLARVLRAQPGQQFEIATPVGVHLGTVVSVSEASVKLSLGELLPDVLTALPQTTLLLALHKFDRLEWSLEKAVELGVTEIHFVIARRSEKHLAIAAEKRMERWHRIVRDAAQQARQPQLPVLHDAAPLECALKLIETEQRILLAETERQHSLWSAITAPDKPIALAIGPIGGWAEDEFKLFAANRWAFASLGNTVLRVETATIAALAIVAQRRLLATSC